MDILTLIVIVAVIGFVLWLAVTYIPMPVPIKNGLIALVALILLLWLLRILFVIPPVLTR